MNPARIRVDALASEFSLVKKDMRLFRPLVGADFPETLSVPWAALRFSLSLKASVRAKWGSEEFYLHDIKTKLF